MCVYNLHASVIVATYLGLPLDHEVRFTFFFFNCVQVLTLAKKQGTQLLPHP